MLIYAVLKLLFSKEYKKYFSLRSAVSGGLEFLRAFCQWKIEHQFSTFFFFFILFL